MLFNSVEFACFLPIVFLLYWFVFRKTFKAQNVLLLIASYYFYVCWDWRFLLLLAFSTVFDFVSGNKIHSTNTPSLKKALLWITIIINIGLLAYFKYFNFFIESFNDTLNLIGIKAHISTLEIILPVGISFYTFHGLSYIIDIYYDKIKPEPSLVNYALFVSFFPLLVAGPIERATHLLPQINRERNFDYTQAAKGLRQILWGLFKKIVIADNCAIFVNNIFSDYSTLSGSTLLLGGVCFAFQIYGDFSGYSDIAIGTSRLFGIELLRNFSFPYFSRDIAEFWRRWHISLTTWFRDYIYIPLGGSRGGKWSSVRNTFIIFLISGFWHGANWTFIVWGAFHALLFMPLLLAGKNRQNRNNVAEGRLLPTPKELFQILSTFTLVVIGWIFFRAESMTIAVNYLMNMFNSSLFTIPPYMAGLSKTLVCIVLMIIVEWIGREKAFALEMENIKVTAVRWIIYMAIITIILEFGASSQSFIYFQF